MPTIRPEINEDLIYRLKVKYPKETALLNNAETLTWAVEKTLKGA